MIRKPLVFPGNAPLTRALAAEVVQTASNFEARVMIQRAQKIVNAKSMLGLLSLGAEDQANMVLIAEGADEAEAADAVLAVLK
ncbi:MAG: HPr family phosphocarrier protein [Clostridiales bacterium]|nr:HPr family phosphocarrier protein [Clostridiales bacterium]